jgi:hypothetical protein
MTTMPAFAEFPLSVFCWSNRMWQWPQGRTYENFHLFESKFCRYGADAKRVRGQRACRDGKRLTAGAAVNAEVAQPMESE